MHRKLMRIAIPLATILILIGGGAGVASASSFAGQNPWDSGCALEGGQARPLPTPSGFDTRYGDDWVVRDSSGVAAGTVQVFHSQGGTSPRAASIES